MLKLPARCFLPYLLLLIRLQKAIAESGIASRRRAEELIEDGRVWVNGAVVSLLGIKVDPQGDRIEVDGLPLPRPKKQYLAFHKPKGILSTRHDPRGRRVYLDYLPARFRDLDYAGRLDADSEGLLILTNDGEFGNRISHPRYGITKSYLVDLQGQFGAADRDHLLRGVSDRGERLIADRCVLLAGSRTDSRIQLWLHEGRNREIRRMLRARGFAVIRLVRVSVGPIQVGSLASGRWRHLGRGEIAGVMSLAAAAMGKRAKATCRP